MEMIDDPLTSCLLWLASAEGASTSHGALVDGLPLVDGKLTPSVFARAAARVSINAQVVRQPLLRLNSLLFPCVVLLEDNRACLLQFIDREKNIVQVVLPELGMQPQQLNLDEFQQSYTGAAIYCRSNFKLDNNKTGAKSTSARVDDHWFWSVIKTNRPVYRDILIAAFFINLLALSMPLFVMNVYDRVVPNHATETLWVLALGVVLIICADLMLRMLRSWFVELAASRADITLSARIMERVLGGRMEQAPSSVGSFASNIQSFESVRSFIGSMTITAIIDLPFFLLFVVIIALISWVMVIPVIIGAVIIILYALSVQASMHKLSDAMSQASAQRNSGLIESLVAAPTLKSFNGSSRMQRTWEQATEFLSACAGKQRMLGVSVGSGASWVQQTVAVVMIIVGVYLVINGDMSQGGLIAAYMLSSRAMAPISQTASLLTQYYQAEIAMLSVDQIMNGEQEKSADKQLVSRPKLRGEIELRNVSFSYPDEKNNALSDVSLHIRAGERVGILGRVGSGKSSLEKLILGLYRPTSGDVLVDGVHIEQIDLTELRSNIGYIPQDVQLLSGSVFDNITLGIDHPSNEKLTEAINLSGLSNLIGSHADGLSMQVGEAGNKLSGGQRQTIAVARAVMADSSILLFDEPTSAMDSSLEAQVGKGLGKFSEDKTLLLVTHRTSLLHMVDRLIVMDSGHIVADGSKQSVLAALEKGTIYRGANK
jgi:ATP-binding cassette subfamily C protein LapB